MKDVRSPLEKLKDAFTSELKHWENLADVEIQIKPHLDVVKELTAEQLEAVYNLVFIQGNKHYSYGEYAGYYSDSRPSGIAKYVEEDTWTCVGECTCGFCWVE